MPIVRKKAASIHSSHSAIIGSSESVTLTAANATLTVLGSKDATTDAAADDTTIVIDQPETFTSETNDFLDLRTKSSVPNSSQGGTFALKGANNTLNYASNGATSEVAGAAGLIVAPPPRSASARQGLATRVSANGNAVTDGEEYVSRKKSNRRRA